MVEDGRHGDPEDPTATVTTEEGLENTTLQMLLQEEASTPQPSPQLPGQGPRLQMLD